MCNYSPRNTVTDKTVKNEHESVSTKPTKPLMQENTDFANTRVSDKEQFEKIVVLASVHIVR